MCEPLRGTKEKLMEGKRGLICVGVREAFEAFESAFEFYERYKGTDGIFTIKDERPDLLEEWKEYSKNNSTKLFWKDLDIYLYNKWIYNISFEDVIKNKEGKKCGGS